ncbi:MAG TPA: hypothetical protein VGU61_07045 [Noviherbaspirillum sp.]|jgi:hypothetical protein|uniref:hypothetical protein n=1 Tax=Noviherbaspirillum sp. TaxID=1926288 RepID=UPI002DDCE26F|nr:hypothetical protein [Noviherbaspirillum sp.]HEV2610007.1 hypothetical protein [Noviherbaspirillum sp.]
MKCCTLFFPALAFVLLGVAAPVQAQEDTVPEPFSGVPYRDPRPLEALLALDDRQFGAALMEKTPDQARQIFAPFMPPAATEAGVSRGFSGLQLGCLQARLLQACRKYAQSLVALHRAKQPAAGTLANPFGPAR